MECFEPLNDNELYQIDGGGVAGYVVGFIVVCTVCFVVGAVVSAYNSYKSMERTYG